MLGVVLDLSDDSDGCLVLVAVGKNYNMILVLKRVEFCQRLVESVRSLQNLCQESVNSLLFNKRVLHFSLREST